MKQLLKIAVEDDTAPAGSTIYVGLYESLRHGFFEVRTIEEPEEGEPRLVGQLRRFEFGPDDYIDQHAAAIKCYLETVLYGGRTVYEFMPEEVPDEHVS